ncbi:MAG: lipid A-modifier LpxR family protein [Alphaproteobacteria bacterium]
MPVTAASIFGLATVALSAPATATASPASIQTALSNPWIVTRESPSASSDLSAWVDRDASFVADEARRGYMVPLRERGSPWAAANRDVWFESGDYDDRLRLRTEGPVRRVDGSPLPPGPLDPAAHDAEHYDLTFTRGWTGTLARTSSGLDVTLSPHLGVGVGSRGSTTEAGATLRIGPELEQLMPAGEATFGQRPRWYLYAAGSGRAVGYNWARTRDGDFTRSGISHDTGAFMGDASLGVAIRQGPVQSSFGLIYRELGPEGMRGGEGLDTDVTEGVIAFQLSIKPE